MDLKQFQNTELLNESALLEILKTRCIQVPGIKTMKKVDLVELFKRVALPLPQRQLNEERPTENKLHELRVARNIAIASEEEKTLCNSVAVSLNNCIVNEKRKSPCEDHNSPASKKMYLPNSTNDMTKNSLKRRNCDTEVSTQREVRKRQKITWP